MEQQTNTKSQSEEILKSVFGYDNFRDQQKDIIDQVIATRKPEPKFRRAKKVRILPTHQQQINCHIYHAG